MTGEPVPAWIVGAWERTSLEIAGRPVDTIGRAVWVQTETAYVDLRAPGAVASDTCFAGLGIWDGREFTWTHEIDRHPRPGSIDRGRLEAAGDELIERGDGIDGGHAPYTERWRRLPGCDGPTAVVTQPGGIAVRAGNHAAFVLDRSDENGSFAARSLRRTGERWVTDLAIGDTDWRPFG